MVLYLGRSLIAGALECDRAKSAVRLYGKYQPAGKHGCADQYGKGAGRIRRRWRKAVAETSADRTALVAGSASYDGGGDVSAGR